MSGVRQHCNHTNLTKAAYCKTARPCIQDETFKSKILFRNAPNQSSGMSTSSLTKAVRKDARNGLS